MDDKWFRRIVTDKFINNLPARYLITHRPDGKLLKKFEETGCVAGKVPQVRPLILEDVGLIAIAKVCSSSKKSVTSEDKSWVCTVNTYKAVHLQPRIKV
jgi:hypothetical protein